MEQSPKSVARNSIDLTIIFSGLTVLISLWNNVIQRRNHKELLKGQIIAQARIEWLREVRKVFYDFIERSADYNTALKELSQLKKSSRDKTIKELVLAVDLPSKRTYFWASLRLLETYFPDSSDGRNQRLRASLKDLSTYLNEYNRKLTKSDYKWKIGKISYLKGVKHNSYYSKILRVITTDFSTYLKEEWELAKREAIGR